MSKSAGIIIVSLAMLFFFFSCSRQSEKVIKLEGRTMGTTYRISFIDDKISEPGNLKQEIDSLLVDFNNSVSTYIPSSVISKVNAPDTLIEVDEYFSIVFLKAQEVSEKTGGAFDVTVMPLVNGWGFGFADSLRMDSAIVDSLLRLVDFRNVRLAEHDGIKYLSKKDKRIQVDFSAIAKGYGVDLVGMLLEKKGIEHYTVEIGGEVRAKGSNGKDDGWKIGIEKPVDDATGNNQELKDILILKNNSLATSGNYRNFYYRNGKKISHEINPETGYPAMNNLLSATVIAADCMTADAFATAFMVMGLEKSLRYLQQDSSLKAYLIYSDNLGEMKIKFTEGVDRMLAESR